jgi:succinyl-diaminopimelate desuccinylase
MKDLLKGLIQAKSTDDAGELAAAKVIQQWLQVRGIDCELSCWDKNRVNVVVHIKSSGQEPGLLFACHLDVVPPGEERWKHPPFTAAEEDGKIYGRGSADMKGSIAALLCAIEQTVRQGCKPNGDIIVAMVAGEETDSCGARRFISEYKDKLPPLAGVIVAEPTNFEVITAHRGLLWLEVVTKGKTAHGSTPHLGVNAITSMRLVLDELDKLNLGGEKHALLGDCSMSVNTIEGGKAVNVVPDRCSVKVDIRTLPSQSHNQIIDEFEKIFARIKKTKSDFDAEVKVVRDVEALETDPQCSFIKEFCTTVEAEKTTTAGFCTDGPFFAALGAPVVIFGPGCGELCHKPDEYIEIADLKKAVEEYTTILNNF